MSDEKLDVIIKQVGQLKESFSGIDSWEDIKREIKVLREDIKSLENKIMLEQAEKLQDRVRVRELESRLSKLEEKFRLAA